MKFGDPCMDCVGKPTGHQPCFAPWCGCDCHRPAAAVPEAEDGREALDPCRDCLHDNGGPDLSHLVDDRPCPDCGAAHTVWFAPNDLWNEVMGGKDAPGVQCPTCFILRAERQGIRVVWALTPEASLPARDDERERLAAGLALCDEAWTFRTPHDLADAIRAALAAAPLPEDTYERVAHFTMDDGSDPPAPLPEGQEGNR